MFKDEKFLSQTFLIWISMRVGVCNPLPETILILMWPNYLEMCSRILAISFYSNEIEIGGALCSKIHQKALGMVKNISNQKIIKSLSLTLKYLEVSQTAGLLDIWTFW